MLINEVIQGDCLEVMKDIPDKSVDMILCENYLTHHTIDGIV